MLTGEFGRFTKTIDTRLGEETSNGFCQKYLLIWLGTLF